ncbi:MAG: carbohydrate ABC transporter permease [Clostridia bacterium]|nr:carbohydrate ABC transporter permease [Clostridia bacterium]
MVKKSRRRFEIADVSYLTVVWLIIIISSLMVLLPILHVLAASFSSSEAVIRGVYLWPRDFCLDGYTAVFQNSKVLRGFVNSVLYTVIGTAFNVVMTICAAYPLARNKLHGRKTIMMLFVFTMLFSGGMIPTYLVVHRLKLVDTFWSMIFPTAINVYLMIIARTFFENTIPNDLYEAAHIDGANDFQLFLYIAIPLSKAICAVLALRYAVQHWNDYYQAVLYIRSDGRQPLQIVLRNIMLATNIDIDSMSAMDVEQYAKLKQLSYLLKYSLIVISTIPMLVLYPFIQKYFIHGVMIGAIKG